MNSNLYHREIYMPKGVLALENYKLELRATAHAKIAATQDRYGIVKIPAAIEFHGRDVVEAEFVNGKLSKVVVRLPYDSRRDAIFVANVDGTLKTVWFNLSRDRHSTLDRSKYASRPSS
jgi:hypothetical protein